MARALVQWEKEAMERINMNLPIKTPSAVDVLVEEVARFRALTPEQQVKRQAEMFGVHLLQVNAASPEEVSRLLDEEKEKERKAIRESIARPTK
jgi:hypothetical protein